MNRYQQQGFTLIEMMISITVASLLSIAVINVFLSQSSLYNTQAQRNRMANDGRDAYEVLSRLIRQAEWSSINISGASGDSLNINFSLPSGYAIWPNHISPYDNNDINLQWNSTGTNANQIRIDNGDGDGLRTLVGDSSGMNTQITNLWFARNNATNNLALTLSARAGSNGPSTSFAGIVVPRN